MELDDLKKQWKEAATASSADAIREAIEKKISTLEQSGRGIRKAFVIEMIMVFVIYVFFWLMVWFFRYAIASYMYNILIVTSVASIPIIWRLYKSQRWINSMDYTMDMRTNIAAFVKYYKRTLRIYEWGTYIMVLVTLLFMLADPTFQVVERSVQITVMAYMFLVCLITRPYVRLMYGRRLSVFEDFLKD